MLSVWRGTTYTGWDPYERRMATPQIIIGAQTLHAAGYAMAARFAGADEIAVTCFGDGAMSQGDTNEAMVFASAFHAPVLRSEEHTSELQSRGHLVCRLLLEKKKKNKLHVAE